MFAGKIKRLSYRFFPHLIDMKILASRPFHTLNYFYNERLNYWNFENEFRFWVEKTNARPWKCRIFFIYFLLFPFAFFSFYNTPYNNCIVFFCCAPCTNHTHIQLQNRYIVEYNIQTFCPVSLPGSLSTIAPRDISPLQPHRAKGHGRVGWSIIECRVVHLVE